ncbi:MAG: SCO family protein [Gemmatimonadales bacterium]
MSVPGTWTTRALLTAAIPLALVSGCAERGQLSPGGYAGAELTGPRPKPEFVLTSMRGGSFDFRRQTDGYVTLLFFGYTHCPDVCPVHMANIGAVLDRLPFDVSSRVRVVFVTTDPSRDTPERLRTWLGGFSHDFIGLTGTRDQVTQAQIAAGVLPAVPDTADSATGDYGVGHAAQVLAYTPDNLERVEYPSGTRQEDWAHDLPMLVRVRARSDTS